MADALNAKNAGSLWIQPGGPNNTSYLLDCHDVAELPVPPKGPGGIEPIKKADWRTGGWRTIGQTETPPGKVSFSISTLQRAQRDWLEKLAQRSCSFYILMRDSGSPEQSNYVRGIAVNKSRIVLRKYDGTAIRKDDKESTLAADIEAWEAVDFYKVAAQKQVNADTDATNDLAANLWYRSADDAGAEQMPGDVAVTASDSAVGPATAIAMSTTDGGATWAATSTAPFAAGASIMSIQRFPFGRTTYRIIAAMEAPAGAQGMVAYSDNNGTSWTTVNIGGAAAGHGASYGRGLCALDSRHILLAGAAGYIYRSVDGGETWTAVESAAIHAGVYNGVGMADEYKCFAWGAAGVCAKSIDGGVTWAATTVPAATATKAGFIIDQNRFWVGNDAAGLYYTTDGGVTWTQRTGWNTTVGTAIRGISFAPGSDQFGFMVVNTAAPVGTVYRTYDGGKEWEPITTPANSGLNGVLAVDENTCYIYGEANGGTTFVAKVTAQ